MKLFTPLAAIIAAAAAGQIYTSQPHENYANTAEIYQSALEYQQQGLYSDQSQAYSGADQSHVFAGGNDQSQRGGEKAARILSLVSENDGHGYQYSYETENGIKAQESGLTSEKGTEAHGAYSYTGDDGQVYTVTYTADETGFHPQGAHLPTSPPIPEAIVKSLEQNAKDEAAGIFDDGKYVEQQQQFQQHQHQQFYQHQQTQQQHPQIQQQQIQQLHQPMEQVHQQTAQDFHYEATAFPNDGPEGYHSLNVPGYHKH